MYRRHLGDLEVFLVHPGGPFWANKDKGAWSIPKGEYSEGEQSLEAAQREFQEETSFTATGPFVELGTIRQTGGKIVTAWPSKATAIPQISEAMFIKRNGLHVQDVELSSQR